MSLFLFFLKGKLNPYPPPPIPAKGSGPRAIHQGMARLVKAGVRHDEAQAALVQSDNEEYV